MAVVTNTVQTMDRVSAREDLTDRVYDLSPTDTPFMNAIGRGKCSAVTHEWQTDDLKAANGDNKAVQGDETTYETQPPTQRLSNHTQIMKKQVIVSGTADAITTAGYAKQYSYEAAKRAKELKRDMEMRLTGAYAKVAPTASVAGELAGFETWIANNASRGTGGADGSKTGGFGNGVTAPTDGTPRAFTEAMIKDVMESARQNGGKPSLMIMGTRNKQVFSGFAGIAPLRRSTGDNQSKATILGAADMYQSDFGTLKAVDSLFSRQRSTLLVDTEYAKTCFLRPIKTEPRAKTGDAKKAEMICEFTLAVTNDKAHGVVADLAV